MIVECIDTFLWTFRHAQGMDVEVLEREIRGRNKREKVGVKGKMKEKRK